ncbi:MAG: hypothetical protein LIR46_10960 [Bacteroidota bacterium]|nr:hypothetical protein [Bacteroidota bacterium]
MNLAQLVVNCIKDTVLNDDKTLTVENLLNGNVGKNYEYTVEANNVLLSINRAVARLQTAKKIPIKGAILTANPSQEIYDISSIKDLRKILSVYVMKNGKPHWVGWSFVSQDMVYLGYGLDSTIHIQYERNIPNFMDNDIQNVDVDLETEYGLSDELCNYISYFVKSELYETRDPDRCKRYLNYFEQFVNEIDKRESIVYQNSVQAKYRW